MQVGTWGSNLRPWTLALEGTGTISNVRLARWGPSPGVLMLIPETVTLTWWVKESQPREPGSLAFAQLSLSAA